MYETRVDVAAGRVLVRYDRAVVSPDQFAPPLESMGYALSSPTEER